MLKTSKITKLVTKRATYFAAVFDTQSQIIN